MNIKLSVNLESTLTSLTERWARRRAVASQSDNGAVSSDAGAGCANRRSFAE